MSGFFNLIKHGKNIARTVASPFTQLRNVRAAKNRDTYKTISSVQPSKNLKKLRDVKDKGFKSVDEKTKGSNVSNQVKSEIKKSFSKKVTDIIENKAEGGRIGLKKGTNPFKRKSNIQKINETFATKRDLKKVDKKKNPGLAKLPMKVRNNMGYAAKGGRAMLKKGSKKKFPDLNKDGKITKADILMGRGVIKKKKKKVI